MFGDEKVWEFGVRTQAAVTPATDEERLRRSTSRALSSGYGRTKGSFWLFADISWSELAVDLHQSLRAVSKNCLFGHPVVPRILRDLWLEKIVYSDKEMQGIEDMDECDFPNDSLLPFEAFTLWSYNRYATTFPNKSTIKRSAPAPRTAATGGTAVAAIASSEIDAKWRYEQAGDNPAAFQKFVSCTCVYSFSPADPSIILRCFMLF